MLLFVLPFYLVIEKSHIQDTPFLCKIKALRHFLNQKNNSEGETRTPVENLNPICTKAFNHVPCVTLLTFVLLFHFLDTFLILLRINLIFFLYQIENNFILKQTSNLCIKYFSDIFLFFGITLVVKIIILLCSFYVSMTHL